MARYFIHLRNGADQLRDLEGSEFGCEQALQDAVLLTARELIAEDAKCGTINFGLEIEALDEFGKLIHTLVFRDAVVTLGNAAGATIGHPLGGLKKLNNHGKDWTSADIRRLRDLVTSNTSFGEIGRMLGRSSASVRNRASQDTASQKR